MPDTIAHNEAEGFLARYSNRFIIRKQHGYGYITR